MLHNNIALYSVKIITEIARDALFFPIWWYSRGAWNLLVGLFYFLKNKQKALGILVWIKNIHRPMYQQYDWQGMLISFFMRLFMIIARGLIWFFWLLAALAVFSAWIALPILIVYQILIQLL